MQISLYKQYRNILTSVWLIPVLCRPARAGPPDGLRARRGGPGAGPALTTCAGVHLSRLPQLAADDGVAGV